MLSNFNRIFFEIGLDRDYFQRLLLRGPEEKITLYLFGRQNCTWVALITNWKLFLEIWIVVFLSQALFIFVVKLNFFDCSPNAVIFLTHVITEELDNSLYFSD